MAGSAGYGVRRSMRYGNVMHDKAGCGAQVGGFMRVRRALLSVLSDAAYDTVQSFHSDSAVAFSIFLHHLPDLTQQQPPHVLLRAMEVRPRSEPTS